MKLYYSTILFGKYFSGFVLKSVVLKWKNSLRCTLCCIIFPRMVLWRNHLTEAILGIWFDSQKSPVNFHCGHEEETQCLASRNGKYLLKKFTSSCKLLMMIQKMSSWSPEESYTGIKLGNWTVRQYFNIKHSRRKWLLKTRIQKITALQIICFPLILFLNLELIRNRVLVTSCVWIEGRGTLYEVTLLIPFYFISSIAFQQEDKGRESYSDFSSKK